MKTSATNSIRSVETELIRRLTDGEWLPGSLIPKEEDLAIELNCSRTTVNRALQRLAGEGLVVRKRRSGTRVAVAPDKKATFQIPIIRKEVENRGGKYSHLVLLTKRQSAPLWVQARFGERSPRTLLHLQTLHLSDSHPHMFEDRWVCTQTTPGILEAPLDDMSANEWLVQKVPYSRGEIYFSAQRADATTARALELSDAAPVFRIERTTWIEQSPITTVRMHYPEGYRLMAEL